MSYYRWYLMDSDGHIRDFNKVTADSDREALEVARRDLVREEARSSGFELWEGRRLVHREVFLQECQRSA